ncbi:hypothetical protein BDK51DRAFT_32443, partial [Blyttiomyces helicus]
MPKIQLRLLGRNEREEVIQCLSNNLDDSVDPRVTGGNESGREGTSASLKPTLCRATRRAPGVRVIKRDRGVEVICIGSGRGASGVCVPVVDLEDQQQDFGESVVSREGGRLRCEAVKCKSAHLNSSQDAFRFPSDQDILSPIPSRISPDLNMTRTFLVGGNWKMNGSRQLVDSIVETLNKGEWASDV